jgi:hypothetical protein
MNLWLIFFATQVLITVIAIVREGAKGNKDLEQDKLPYRS